MADDKKDDTSGGVSTFVSSLVFNVAVAVCIFIVFTILRPRFKRVYAPRTYAVSKERRSEPISDRLLAWVPMVLRVPDEKIIERVGLDTYMFLRYMRSMFVMFVVLSLLSVVTILPANITGGNGVKGMAILTMGNVRPDSKTLWVHIVFFMVFVVWVLWNIFGEFKVYTRLRIWWLTNPKHASRVGASTIMVSTLPQALIGDDDRISSVFNMFPGGVRQVIVNRNCTELEDIVEERDSLAMKLEGTLTSYAVKCEKDFKKATKKGATFKEPKRPTMRKSKIPFKGPKLDAIEYLSTEIAKLNKQISEAGGEEENYKRQSTAFVFFNKQIAAHMAAQTVLDYKPFSMNSVSLDVHTDDIIWSNLNLNPYDRRMRGYLSLAATIGLVITWTLLTAAISALVSVEKLSKTIPGLKSLADSEFFGLFTGIIPSAVLAAVMALLPIILRLLLRLEGTPRRSEIDMRLLNRFFFFQVWNVYLVTIFTSSILSIAESAFSDPGIILEQIQEQVPASATPILTYILLLAFTGAAKEILQVVRLALRYVLPLIFAKTPRKICNAETPAAFDWATSIPMHSLVFLMGFSYSFIAPIVNCFVAVYFGLFYLVYRYQFLYVYNDANWSTGGLSFPVSIKQTLVGVYISEIYMLLMMVAKLVKNKHIDGNAVLRVIFPALILLLTIGAHIYINDAYMPIINYLPIRGAVEIEENPKIATTYPDFTGDGELNGPTLMDSGSSTTPESEIRKRIYAVYGTLVPKKIIDFILNRIPSILDPRKQSSPNNTTEDLADEEENGAFKSGSVANSRTVDSAFIPMPTPHHYSETESRGAFEDLNMKRASGNTNILTIDSNTQQKQPPAIAEPASPAHAAADGVSNQQDPSPQFIGGLAPTGTTRSIHSYDSTTELRQRRRMPTANSQAAAQRKSRYSMYDNELLASAGENALAKAFSNPALRAKPKCNIWVPLDNHGLCNELYNTVQRLGEGTIRIISRETWIDEKAKVKANVEFDPDCSDSEDIAPTKI
ncbi:phosphate metabolism protein 7 [Coemansia sp. RSA 1813]|nr:phosphate metabolism protein 7 [Coemansia sp. RSA 1646]KAJ1770052.1 phosphate metabolism protein 7 [Coemansia sp. RSA 1843]KAJ2087446.1 phosphate metabolism protein 7 [Coemansia sp. RSA 986]KAJ2212436.1 phosphate metabolism protein 7 [Coemansia sp. RSA 487]KAJ2566394.1 phosphate metabolism protein 7 [Coemansia sp. RSA 1813]